MMEMTNLNLNTNKFYSIHQILTIKYLIYQYITPFLLSDYLIIVHIFMAKYFQNLVFILLLASPILAARNFKKVVVADADALCLDGTKGAYYISEGKESTKFLISFEGGGWCGSSASLDATLNNCL
jgi:hypothetical protein